MKYTFDCDRWGSSFSVPSKVVDKYIKLSDGDFVKVLLCILCSTERECDSAKLAEKSGLPENTVIDAVTHWVSLGVITTEHSDTTKPAQVKAVSTPVSEPETKAEPVSKVEAVAPKRQSVSNKLCIRYKNSEILENSRRTLTLHISLTRYKPYYNALSMELSKGNFLLFMSITDLMLHLFS